MNKDGKVGTFALRLPNSTRIQAISIAKHEGISLNQLITLSVIEKIARLELMLDVLQRES